MRSTKGSEPVKVDAVADYFILQAREAGDPITPLKLQKLVYYAQAWHLALHGDPLVNDRFEAWVHGPVCPNLYSRFRGYGWQPIADEVDAPELAADVVEFLDDVWDAYGSFTAVALERMTHAERPWLDARGGLPADESSNAEIPQKAMRDYYRTRLDVKAEK